jgi:hypothetical protein
VEFRPPIGRECHSCARIPVGRSRFPAACC